MAMLTLIGLCCVGPASLVTETEVSGRSCEETMTPSGVVTKCSERLFFLKVWSSGHTS